MRAHVENSMTRELPNNVPFSAKVSLIKEFQYRWPEAAKACFSAVHDNLMRQLLACVHSDFGRWESLHGQIRNFMTDLVKKHADACQTIIKTMLESEHTPFTQNEHYLHTCEEKWLSIQGCSCCCVQASIIPEAESASFSIQEQNELLAHLMQFGHQVQSLADLAKLSPPDEFETEMMVMAQVRSYFQVAYKRVIDTIPSMIDLVFLKGVQNDIQNFLLEKIQIGGKDGRDLCARYLAEDPDVVARRDEIMARQETLEKVKAELYSFGI
ncbi:hypothetical protein EWM64_g941 [Hericium alpestre]|uniref:GED domain-containing protein n=1 Tax=Hericium alpestre TaxID=135208 RepID=A0A4Z0A9U0_9AGAM|nr:hypothetical protein EWM64_g941 [Hericium alpestre]